MYDCVHFCDKKKNTKYDKKWTETDIRYPECEIGCKENGCKSKRNFNEGKPRLRN